MCTICGTLLSCGCIAPSGAGWTPSASFCTHPRMWHYNVVCVRCGTVGCVLRITYNRRPCIEGTFGRTDTVCMRVEHSFCPLRVRHGTELSGHNGTVCWTAADLTRCARCAHVTVPELPVYCHAPLLARCVQCCAWCLAGPSRCAARESKGCTRLVCAWLLCRVQAPLRCVLALCGV